eukprot:GHUV01044628.1.p1 GENE.GHUV01044628.1~~GHUV01044628.1.p1  ORF type:complete len:126 (+),score=59.40 GHUV01044628.1:361-738(+)
MKRRKKRRKEKQQHKSAKTADNSAPQQQQDSDDEDADPAGSAAAAVQASDEIGSMLIVQSKHKLKSFCFNPAGGPKGYLGQIALGLSNNSIEVWIAQYKRLLGVVVWVCAFRNRLMCAQWCMLTN